MAAPHPPGGTVAVPHGQRYPAPQDTDADERAGTLTQWIAVAGVLAGAAALLAVAAPGRGAVDTPTLSTMSALLPGATVVVDHGASFDTYFEELRRLPVQENAEAMIVRPVVSEDPHGGLLVADSRESQIRRISSDGDLLGYFGRPGDGPREFRALSSVIRLANGELLATEMSGRLTITDSSGTHVLKTVQVPIEPVWAATVLNDSTVILTGLSQGNLVHLWDPYEGKIRSSFYPVPEHPAEMEAAYSYTGFPGVSVRGDTIAVLFALSDDLRFFRNDGTELEEMRMRLPYRHFRRVREGSPADASPEAFRAWTESFSVGSRIYWLQDDTFIVQYFDRAGNEQNWSVLHMDREGRALFEGRTPKLLTILRRTTGQPELLFEAADNEEPNQWRLASFRLSSR